MLRRAVRLSAASKKTVHAFELFPVLWLANSIFLRYWLAWFTGLVLAVIIVQSNLYNTDTKGTEQSVRFTEVSVL